METEHASAERDYALKLNEQFGKLADRWVEHQRKLGIENPVQEFYDAEFYDDKVFLPSVVPAPAQIYRGPVEEWV